MNVREFFKLWRANPEKSKAYGFRETDGGYLYETPIMSGQFLLSVTAARDGAIFAQLTDTLTEEEYVLHSVEGSTGEFVGRVRSEFEAALTEIRDACFDKEIFKGEQTKRLISYIREQYGDELEHLWADSPTYAVFRRKDNRKWYGVFMGIPRKRLFGEGDEQIEILDLRANPNELLQLLDGKSFFAGYHMNKKHWITVCLNRDVSDETVCRMIDASFFLAAKK